MSAWFKKHRGRPRRDCPPQPPSGSAVRPDAGISAAVDAAERYEDDRPTFGDRIEYLVLGRRRAPGPSFSGAVEPPAPGKIGIACSGGGIRSASFNLGALQALQQKGILADSTYLAGVSGGSYIAAAFCSVHKSWGNDDSEEALLARKPPFAPGSPEEQYLRNRCAYLAPRLTDKIALGWRVLLGLAINLAVFGLFLLTLAVPLAAAYGAIYPKLGQSLTKCNAGEAHCGFTAWPPPPGVWIPMAAAFGTSVLFGILPLLAFRWPSSLQDFFTTWSLRLMLATAAAAVLLVGMPELLALVREFGEHHKSVAAEPQATATAAIAITGGGAATVASGVLLTLRADWLQVRKAAKEVAGVAKWYTGLGQRLRRGIALTIAVAVAPALALALVLVVMSAMLNLDDAAKLWIWAGCFAAALAVAYFFVDLTSWSLHPFYRRRLASVFALRRTSRGDHDPPTAQPDVGVAVERDYDRPLALSSMAPPAAAGKASWPTLLICAAANISDDAATPPGRAVTSFTFSAGSVGGPLVGAVAAKTFEDTVDPYQRTRVTVPAAVAMSGAALSPSMGKMTRRPLRMLIALANVRLGVWVPNPRRLADFERRRRRPRPLYLLREVFGINPVNSRFLYVTDGGHYDNLGVVELLRRGCTEVFAFDASNDSFDALGDAVSLARSELGVEIDLETKLLHPGPKKGLSRDDCVEGTLTYPDGTRGRIFYSRPVITETAPGDVRAYHQQDRRFPHDPTGDQLYTDQRFEAYRAIGMKAGHHAAALFGAA